MLLEEMENGDGDQLIGFRREMHSIRFDDGRLAFFSDERPEEVIQIEERNRLELRHVASALAVLLDALVQAAPLGIVGIRAPRMPLVDDRGES